MEVVFSLNEQAKEFESTIIDIYNIALKQTSMPENVVVNVVFVSPEEIKELNKKFRGIDKVTDVLSFPMIDNFEDFDKEIDFSTGLVEIGDIYINPIRAKEQAEEYGHSFKREVCFLALHGLLHLLGYDHMTVEDEKQMFELQDIIMEKANLRRE